MAYFNGNTSDPRVAHNHKTHSHKSSVQRTGKGKSIIASLDDYVVIDLETTGLSPSEDEIIEFGGVLVENGEIVDTFSSLANPGREIPQVVTLKTGITNDMVASAPPVAKVLFDFLHFIRDLPLVGHNVGFDVDFLFDSSMRHYGHGIDNDHVDTLRIARRSIKYLPNYKLGTVLGYYGISNDRAHRADSDALCTRQLYERLKGYILYDDALPESYVFGGYSYDLVYDAIQRIIGYDEDNVSLRLTKNGASIYMYGGVAFSVRINTRTQCLDTQAAVALDYLGRIPGATASGGVCHIPISNTADVRDTVEALVKDVYNARKAAVTGEMFGCCNDFVRCSDARACLHKNNPDYLGCLYRRNLEAGRIFYGKNRNVCDVIP